MQDLDERILNLDERIGTNGPDRLRGAADTILYTLGGNDQLTSVGGGADFQILFGGPGNDVYRIGNGHYAAVFDTAGNDRLEIVGIPFFDQDANAFVARIDGRHIGAVNEDTGTEVYLLNVGQSSINQIVLDDAVVSLAELLQALPTLDGFVGNLRWEELAQFGYTAPSTPVINQTLTATATREAQLVRDPGAPPPDGGGGSGGGSGSNGGGPPDDGGPGGLGEGLSVAEARVVALLYEGALDRNGVFDEGAPGVDFWIDRREGPVTLEDGRVLPQLSESQLALFFLAAPEFRAKFGEALDPGAPTYLEDEGFVLTLYQNLLDRDPLIDDRAGFDFWFGRLQDPGVGRDDLLLSFVKSNENAADLPIIDTLTEVAPGDWDFVG